MTQKKKTSQDKNKIKKGKVVKDDAPKDFRAERDSADYIKEEVKFDLQIKPQRFKHTARQENVLDKMGDENTVCVCLDAHWGTGKSYMATLAAIKLLNAGVINKIVYSRNPVESSNVSTIGILPGSLEERMAPYNAVLIEKLREILPAKEAGELVKSGVVEFIPPGLIQGRSFYKTLIICDECSSLSFEDFLMMVSRVGDKSRIFFIGDDFQSCIAKSGFARFFDAFFDQESVDRGVHCLTLKEESDIVRSGFVRFAMEKLGVLKVKKASDGDERECALGFDFQTGKIEEGNIIDRVEIEKPKPSKFESIFNKIKLW